MWYSFKTTKLPRSYSFSLVPEMTGKPITISSKNVIELIDKMVDRMKTQDVLKHGYIGQLDSISVWNKPLSKEEATMIYNMKRDFESWVEFPSRIL